MNTVPTSVMLQPYKSVAAALLFSVFLGPVGLLYASFRGGFIMIAFGIVILSSKLWFPILLFWIFCSVWSVGAVEAYNKKILQMSWISPSLNDSHRQIKVNG